jgi:hypothetical protein
MIRWSGYPKLAWCQRFAPHDDECSINSQRTDAQHLIACWTGMGLREFYERDPIVTPIEV